MAGERIENRATVNSYCGLARHGTTWNLRGKWMRLADSHPQLVPVPDRSKVLLRKETPCLTTPA